MKKFVKARQHRKAVKKMNERGLSLRRSCALIGFERSSLYYMPHPQDNGDLCKKLKAIAQRFKHFGYRRAHALIARRGEIVNHKRVYRLWRLLGLCLPRKRPRKKTKRRDRIPMLAECLNHVWTYDFMFDSNDTDIDLREVRHSIQCLLHFPTSQKHGFFISNFRLASCM